MTVQFHILLVEDEAVPALDRLRTLELSGYQVTLVHSGEAAVELTRQYTFDVILMDIRLGPGIDGITAARRIVQHNPVPIIFLTSLSPGEVLLRIERARLSQKSRYLPKNSTPTEVIRMISRVTGPQQVTIATTNLPHTGPEAEKAV